MKRKLGRILSWLLCIAMITSMFPVSAFAENTSQSPLIEVQSLRANPGSTADVQINLKNNPGVATVILKVNYDSAVLTLESFDYGPDFAKDGEIPPSLNSPVPLTWSNSSKNVSGDATYATLHFAVNESAEVNTSTEVKVSYRKSDIINIEEDDVEFQIQNGVVEIVAGIPGDINGDREVNGKDLLRMRKYFSGWDVEVDMIAMDVTGDGEVNGKDLLRFRKYWSGWPVELYYGPIVSTNCSHSMTAVAAKAPTCVEQGNNAYWICSKCLKYFSDAEGENQISSSEIYIQAEGHTLITLPAEEATYEKEGKTEGVVCSKCSYVEKEQVIIPVLMGKQYSITYNVAGNDSYLMQQNIQMPEANVSVFTSRDEVVFEDLTCPGYRFLGWYDAYGNPMPMVSKGTARNITVYAKWEAAPQHVVFNYDSELAGLIDTSKLENFTYTVNKTTSLPILSLSGYTFVGWSDENGVLRTQIKPGSTGEKEYYANWISNRNKAVQNKKLSTTYLYEDDTTIVFTYEIGRIENVPLYLIENFGYINANGITETKSKEIAVQMSEEMMQEASNTVEKATTGNATWTLSNGWSDSISISQEWAEENNTTVGEEEAKHRSETGNWYVNTTTGSSSTSTVVDSSDTYDLTTTTNNKKTYNSGETTDKTNSINESGWNVSSSLEMGSKESLEISVGSTVSASAEVSGKIPGVGKASASASASVSEEITAGVELEQKSTFSGGFDGKTSNETGSETTKKTGEDEDSGSAIQKGTISNHSSTSSNTSSWSNESGYGGSETNETSQKISYEVSKLVSNKTGYGSNYISTENISESQGLSTTDSNTDSFSSKIAYSKLTQEKETVSYTTGGAVTGYHRWVMAGTAHVFGMVGYDKKTESYFVTTYTVMDDEAHKYQDYSYKTAKYDDNQSGIINFEIPDDVINYVRSRTFATEGLEFDLNGYVTGYTGTDSAVVIPEYVAISNKDGTNTLVKVIGIKENAFKGNTNITGVALSDFIWEIPAHAFEGCTGLWEVFGAGVDTIGEGAFAGCVNLRSFTVTNQVETMGDGAFADAKFVEVKADNAAMVKAAVDSGAEEIVIDLNSIKDPADGSQKALDNTRLHIPEETKSFTIRGYGKEYQNLILVSDAETTKINRLNINSTLQKTDSAVRQIPLELNSANVTLYQSTVNAEGIAALLNDPNIELNIYGTVNLTTSGAYSLFCRNTKVSKVAGQLYSELKPTGKVITCGTIEGQNYLNLEDSEIVQVSEEMFEKLLNSFHLIFNANGGSCEMESMEVPNGVAVGGLPIPEREYFTFDGWYTEDGEPVDQDTVFVTAADITLYAHWSQQTCTLVLNGNGGSVESGSVTVNCGATVGTLPTPVWEYHTFDGWYTEAEGGERVDSDTIYTSVEGTTLYAHWTQQTYTVYFNANGGYVGTDSKTVNCGSPVGEMPVPGYDYHKFDGWYTGDGARVDSNYMPNTDVTLYAHWYDGDVSEWVQASQMPGDAQVVSRKWTYTRTSYAESTSTTLSGYSCYDSYWVKSGEAAFSYSREFPSGFDTSNWYYQNWNRDPVSAYENATNKREVQTGWNGFIYYHWAINAPYYNSLERAVAPWQMTWNKWAYNYFCAFDSTTNCDSLGTGYSCGTGTPSYNCVNVMPDKSSLGTYTPRFFRFNFYWCAYQDYYKVFKYVMVENNLEASSYPGGDNISNIAEWVQYRNK